VGCLCPTARSERALRKRLTGALFLRGVLLMRDDPFADDYANVVRCADCRCLLGTSSSSPVKLCAECALGETPKETMLFCPDCGTQRSRLDTEHDAYMVREWGTEWPSTMKRLKREYEAMEVWDAE
jgi:hypothetical protein